MHPFWNIVVKVNPYPHTIAILAACVGSSYFGLTNFLPDPGCIEGLGGNDQLTICVLRTCSCWHAKPSPEWQPHLMSLCSLTSHMHMYEESFNARKRKIWLGIRRAKRLGTIPFLVAMKSIHPIGNGAKKQKSFI